MKAAILSPLPPTCSGVAHYASLVIPALAQKLDLRAFDSLDGYRADDFDLAIYQLGNNPHHEVMYAEAIRRPGVSVLHDLVLHHLIVEMTLARGDVEGYVSALERNHGAMGAAWARGRAAGMHDEIANFLMPASIEVAQRSRAVIVHNQYARERLESYGVTTPIVVVPHPWIPGTPSTDRNAIRARYGIAERDRVIGLFGFLTAAKRSGVVLEAFRAARAADSRLVLLIVGEPAPDIDLEAMAGEGVIVTGYVPDDEFTSFYAAADRLVNLRYPTAGEASGTLIRAFDAGKAVAVSDYAQFAELPDECVFRVPLGEGESGRLIEFFTRDFPDPAPAQRRWLETNSRLDLTIDGYLQALDLARQPHAPQIRPSRAVLPLFPQLSLVDAREGEEIVLLVRNAGDATLATRTYGRPEYRLIARMILEQGRTLDRWLALPCDLRPGETAELSFRREAGLQRVELHHAIQDIPSAGSQPWAAVELSRVR